MENETLHDLIERYLGGDLSETERLEVERLLASDADFRAEVALQRAIKQHLGDPDEVRLRTALDSLWRDIGSGHSQPGHRSRPFFRVWWRYMAAAAAIVLLITVWWWFRPSPSTPELPVAENPARPGPVQEVPRTHPQPTPPGKQPDKRPIALANPADFSPNPALEAFIGGVRGNGDLEIVLSGPAPGAAFQLKNGRLTLPVKGMVHTDSVPADQPLHLLVYSNRPADWNNKQALFDLPCPLESAGQDQYRFDFSRKLQLRPGLYYIVVGQRRAPGDGEGYRTLFVGKISVYAG